MFLILAPLNSHPLHPNQNLEIQKLKHPSIRQTIRCLNNFLFGGNFEMLLKSNESLPRTSLRNHFGEWTVIYNKSAHPTSRINIASFDIYWHDNGSNVTHGMIWSPPKIAFLLLNWKFKSYVFPWGILICCQHDKDLDNNDVCYIDKAVDEYLVT